MALPHPPIPARPGPGGAPVAEVRCPDAAWHFRLALPDGKHSAWTIGPGALVAPSSSAPSELGVYGQGDLGAEIRVLGALVDREIDPADWLDLSPLVEGKSIVSRLLVPTPAGHRGDLLATWTEGRVAVVGRFLATKVGGRIFAVAARMPLERYLELAPALAISLGTLRPLDAGGGPYAEPMLTLSEAMPVRWSVRVPESWNLEPGSKSPDIASFQAANVRSGDDPGDEELVGKLACAVFARGLAKRPRDVAELYLGAVREHEISIDRDEFDEEEARRPFQRSWRLISGVDRGGVRGELRCRVMQHPEVWMLAGVLSPARDDDAAAWMQNKRALDVVTGAVRLED